MSTATSTHPQPGKKSARPSVWRQLGCKYVDILICGFIAWVICSTFQLQSVWSSLTVILFVVEHFWCRDRLNPTAGEYCLGIRYLTSSSSQVVADIQVIQPKLKLNGFVLTAGIVELTLAILLFSGWSFLPQAAAFGVTFGPPLSVAYWALGGFAFFVCSGYLLSGSKFSFVAIPVIHGLFLVDLFMSHDLWTALLPKDSLGGANLAHAIHAEPFPLLNLFILWSLYLLGTLLFSRKHLVN